MSKRPRGESKIESQEPVNVPEDSVAQNEYAYGPLLYEIMHAQNECFKGFRVEQTVWVIDENPPCVCTGICRKKLGTKVNPAWAIEFVGEEYRTVEPYWCMFRTDEEAQEAFLALVRAMNTK